MLSNEDFKQLLDTSKGGKALVGGVQDARIQGASIDLTVGKIKYVERNGFGGTVRERPQNQGLTLPPSHIAVVETAEVLALPHTHGGIMFPKSSNLAQRGILVTNFGHVDPGFEGPLTYTVINTSNRDFKLRPGEPLATLLVFKLESEATKKWVQRKEVKMDDDEIRQLGTDFLHISDRANEIARAAVTSANLTLVAVTAVVTLFLSVGSVWLTQLIMAPTAFEQRVVQLESRERTETLRSMSERISALEGRLPPEPAATP